MATKLNQIVALVKGKKNRFDKLITAIHHGWKEEGLIGISRTYSPLEDGGIVYPPENHHVQIKVMEILTSAMPEFADFMNVIATQETNNRTAKADVIVDDVVILPQVPVSLLMFLDKQLVSLHTLIDKLPLLDADKLWTLSDTTGLYITQPAQSIKVRKIPQVMTKAQATEHHPAQTEMFMADKPEGTWTTVISSGAIPKTLQKTMLAKVIQLRDAVKVAREQANDMDVTPEKQFGNQILSFIFNS